MTPRLTRNCVADGRRGVSTATAVASELPRRSTGSDVIHTPPVKEVTPLPISKRFSSSPRRKARPRIDDFPVRVGPTAEMIANGCFCARSTARPCWSTTSRPIEEAGLRKSGTARKGARSPSPRPSLSAPSPAALMTSAPTSGTSPAWVAVRGQHVRRVGVCFCACRCTTVPCSRMAATFESRRGL